MFFSWKSIWWLPLFAAAVLAAALLLPTPVLRPARADEPSPVLVIDAGHGGADGGALASDGTPESGLNLDIALRLKELAAFWGVKTALTRQSDAIDYPEDALSLAERKRADQYARVALVNSTPGAVLLSIHQNKFPAAAPFGPQVFYGKNGGEELAALLQQNLTSCLCPENRRVAAPIDEDIFLLRKAACPAVLAECGFLSNPDELAKLETPAYRQELAAIFLASYLEYTGERYS